MVIEMAQNLKRSETMLSLSPMPSNTGLTADGFWYLVFLVNADNVRNSLWD